jgi:hypothetical protein
MKREDGYYDSFNSISASRGYGDSIIAWEGISFIRIYTSSMRTRRPTMAAAR